MILLVAAVAISMVIVREFWEGFPPQFVLRGIPARIGRLRPGMTRQEAREVLGLEKSWMWGGTSARAAHRHGNGRHSTEVYYVRPPRPVVRIARVGGGDSAPVSVYKSSAMIQLWFHHDRGSLKRGRYASARLVRASFSDGSRSIAEMPNSR
jgi:hypothetical protein